MSEPATNNVHSNSFSVASLLLVVGLFAVLFAVAKVMLLLGAVMVAATLPAFVAVVVACMKRNADHGGRPVAVFLAVSAITFVLLVWWSGVGWTLGLLAGKLTELGLLVDSVDPSIHEAIPQIGAFGGLAVGMFGGLLAGLDLALFAPLVATTRAMSGDPIGPNTPSPAHEEAATSPTAVKRNLPS